jgi:hypothetical protein
MPDAPAFEHQCHELEAGTSLDRLEARGTVRLALKQAGLDPRSVTAEQLGVVLEKVLPGELAARGVADAAALCRRWRSGHAAPVPSGPAADSPQAVFARLGGRA